MPAFDASNPDHLAALISGYDTKSACQTERDYNGKNNGMILDSLARLAVCRRQGQIISIGTVKVGEKIELVVADNGNVEKNVISFLERFLNSLSKIRKRMIPPVVDKSALLEGTPPSVSDKIPGEDDGQRDREIHALKVMVLRHNLPKIRRRFFKHYYRFQDFYFHFIEDENPPRSMKCQEPLLTNISETLIILKMAFGLLSTTSGDNVMDLFSVAIREIDILYVDRSELFDDCTNYINREESLEKFDVLCWLDKIVSTHVHFGQAVRNAMRSSMGDFLDSELPLKITALENEPVSITFSVTRGALVKLFKSMDWTAKGDDGFTEDDVFDAIRDGFKRSHQPSNKGKPLKKGMRVDCSEDEIRFNLRLAVHSECAVLEHLIHRPTAMRRIGVSEPSCIACHIFCGIRTSIFRTTETDSLFPPTWRCPTDDGIIRAEMCKRLLPKLIGRARHLEDLQRKLRRKDTDIRIAPSHESVGTSSSIDTHEARLSSLFRQ